MKLEKVVYDHYYDTLEIDKKNGSERAKSLASVGKYGRLITGAGTLFFASQLMSTIRRKYFSRREFITNLGALVASSSLTVHMQKIKEIFDSIYERDNGVINDKEISELENAGKTGRVSHSIALIGLSTVLGSETIGRRDFLGASMAAILGVGYFAVTRPVYEGIYQASVDYAIGVRR